MNIKINPSVLKELEYMVELHDHYGAPNTMDTVDDLVAYILASIADGSRRPGSWERQLLEMMGLVSDSDEHEIYRADYGKE